MVWPFGGSSGDNNKSDTTKDGTQSDKKEKVFLDDVPPKFSESELQKAKEAREKGEQAPNGEDFNTAKEIKRYVRTLSPEDFKFSNLIQIPCFRDAGLAGFSCFFVFSSVLFVYHRDVRKSLNWGFGGLLLGSVFGWEHCNRIRRHSEQVVQMAQQRYQEKRNEKYSKGEVPKRVKEKQEKQEKEE